MACSAVPDRVDELTLQNQALRSQARNQTVSGARTENASGLRVAVGAGRRGDASRSDSCVPRVPTYKLGGSSVRAERPLILTRR